MDDTFQKLLAEAMTLLPEDRSRLVRLIEDAIRVHRVQDSQSRYGEPFARPTSREIDGMTPVTIVLPDDLAKQAQAAGLLAETRFAELIRHALNERDTHQPPGADHDRRRLIRRNGRLVVEALPDEPPITDEDVRDLLNKADW